MTRGDGKIVENSNVEESRRNELPGKYIAKLLFG